MERKEENRRISNEIEIRKYAIESETNACFSNTEQVIGDRMYFSPFCNHSLYAYLDFSASVCGGAKFSHFVHFLQPFLARFILSI